MENKLTPGSNVRWESMRMMIPEHVKALRQHARDRQKIERPELCEDDIAEIEHELRLAIKKYEMIEMSYYKDGFIKHRICHPAQLDPINKQLIFRDIHGIKLRIDFQDIMYVKMNTVQK